MNFYLRKSLIFSNSSPRIIDQLVLCAYHDALSLRNSMVFSPAITLYCALISRNAAYWFIAWAERIFDWCDNKRKIGRIIEGCLSLREACSRVWDNAVLLRHGISISRVSRWWNSKNQLIYDTLRPQKNNYKNHKISNLNIN